MKTKMLKHQEDAFNKLKKFKVGALFMDMGTGKTRTVLELINLKKNKFEKVLWFTPFSLKKNLELDIKKHTNFTTEIISNEVKADSFINIIGTESLGMSDLLYINIKKYIEKYKVLLVVDESSQIKTHDSKRSERMFEFSNKIEYKYILNGTPLTLGYQDLFSQFRVLNWKILGYKSFYSFAANHLEWNDTYKRYEKAHKTDLLVRKIENYTFQIKKEECLELPDKVYTYESFEINEEQKRQYHLKKEKFFSQILDMDFGDHRVSILIFKLFLDLQKITSGLTLDRQRDNNRLDCLEKILKNRKGKKIVWIKFLDEAEIIKRNVSGFNFYTYYGKNKDYEEIEKFKESDNENDVLLISLASGAFGLNLQEANISIFYSSTFNFALNKQAEDRIYRFGQKNNVEIISLFAWGTIDERIIDNLSEKNYNLKALVSAIKDKQELRKFLNFFDNTPRAEYNKNKAYEVGKMIRNLTNKDSEFYRIMGPYLANRAIIKDNGGYPLFDDDNKIWKVVLDNNQVKGFMSYTNEKSISVKEIYVFNNEEILIELLSDVDTTKEIVSVDDKRFSKTYLKLGFEIVKEYHEFYKYKKGVKVE